MFAREDIRPDFALHSAFGFRHSFVIGYFVIRHSYQHVGKNRGIKGLMKRYTPSLSRARADWLRQARQRRARTKQHQGIPDNSEPWLDREPESVGDLVKISDEIARLELKWRPQQINS